MSVKNEYLSPDARALSIAGQIVKGVASNVSRVAFRKPMLGHDIMIERFVDSIINNQPVPVAPEEGRETVRVMELIVEKLQKQYHE